MYSGVLDRVMVTVTEELGKDEKFVARFKELTVQKVEELLPEFAGKAAEKVCDQARQEAGYRESPLVKNVQERLNNYFSTPEGAQRLDDAITRAIEATLTGKAVEQVVEQYIGQRVGILARDAVCRAIDLEKRKQARKTKKAQATA